MNKKFLSVRNRAPSTFMSKGPGKNIGGNELTLAGVVKEDLTCSGSSLPKKKGGPLPKVYKRTSPQAHKLSHAHPTFSKSLTMKRYPLLWDFIRLNRKV